MLTSCMSHQSDRQGRLRIINSLGALEARGRQRSTRVLMPDNSIGPQQLHQHPLQDTPSCSLVVDSEFILHTSTCVPASPAMSSCATAGSAPSATRNAAAPDLFSQMLPSSVTASSFSPSSPLLRNVSVGLSAWSNNTAMSSRMSRPAINSSRERSACSGNKK